MKDKGISVEEARAKNSSWAITYADLVTLLLTFFVLLLVILNEEALSNSYSNGSFTILTSI